jgi:hypothetical protein
MSILGTFLVLIAPAAVETAPAPAPSHCDILIYGGTAGGGVAAVQAAGMGKRLGLAEPGEHLGGMSSGGLGWTDFGSKRGKAEIGGLAREFYCRVGRHYGRDEESTLGPHVAEQVFDEWVKVAGVTVLFHQRIASVEKEGRRIRAVVMEDGAVLRAAMFLDTTLRRPACPAAGRRPGARLAARGKAGARKQAGGAEDHARRRLDPPGVRADRREAARRQGDRDQPQSQRRRQRQCVQAPRRMGHRRATGHRPLQLRHPRHQRV